MTAKGDSFENSLLKLIFNATAIANLADNAASSPLASLFCSLHTASPGEGGNQTTSEATYTPYARVAVARTTGGWTVTGNVCENAVAITFPMCTSGTSLVTHGAIGRASSGTGEIFYYGALTSSLSVSANVTPEYPVGLLDITED